MQPSRKVLIDSEPGASFPVLRVRACVCVCVREDEDDVCMCSVAW